MTYYAQKIEALSKKPKKSACQERHLDENHHCDKTVLFILPWNEFVSFGHLVLFWFEYICERGQKWTARGNSEKGINSLYTKFIKNILITFLLKYRVFQNIKSFLITATSSSKIKKVLNRSKPPKDIPSFWVIFNTTFSGCFFLLYLGKKTRNKPVKQKRQKKSCFLKISNPRYRMLIENIINRTHN